MYEIIMKEDSFFAVLNSVLRYVLNLASESNATILRARLTDVV